MWKLGSCIGLALCFASLITARDKYIKIEKVSQCLNSDNFSVQLLTSEVNNDFRKNQVILNSTILFRKKMGGDIQV